MRSAPFWVVTLLTTQKSTDLVCVTVNGIYVIVLGFVQLWVLCSSFVDISIVDVEYFTKPYECHSVEYLDVFVLLTPCRTNMAAMPNVRVCCAVVMYVTG